MNWEVYGVFFLLSTVKFLFTPFGGAAAQLTFIETYFSCVSGGVFSAAVFYYSSEFFLIRAHKKRVRLREEALAKGIVLKVKPKFTRTNKLVVRIKRRLGIIGISMYAPLFLSVPIGSIITAKFYGKDKRTFPLIVLGMFVNGGITTGLSYGAAYLF